MDYLLHHSLLSTTEKHPDKEALIYNKSRLSFDQVATQSGSLARGLRKAGLKRGDRVGIYLNTSIEQVLAIYGSSQAAGVFVPINTLLFPEQVAHIANDCQIKALITTASGMVSLKEALAQCPSIEFIVIVEDGELPESPLPSYKFSELCIGEPLKRDDGQAISKDLAALIYTSGSTGKPKGVMLSHSVLLAGTSIVSDYLSISEDDRILAALPFSFDAGLNQLTTAFQQGATLVLINFVFAKQIVSKLIEEKITGLAGVPTLWNLISQPNSGFLKQPLPHLRYITNTGGAMSQAVLPILRSHLPETQIFLMYGLTEAFRSTYLNPAELDRRPTSMGKAIPDTEILVINDEGQRCKAGEVGELVHRGPTVSLGYWQQPELTAKCLRPHPLLPSELADRERVCYSGDLVKTDEEGFLYFVARRDTMIKSSGYRVSPTEVEEVLIKSGMLRDAAVVGVADSALGEAIKAYVVSNESTTFDSDSLKQFCAESLPRYMVPKHIEILDTLPKTTSGKVDYAELRGRN